MTAHRGNPTPHHSYTTMSIKHVESIAFEWICQEGGMEWDQKREEKKKTKTRWKENYKPINFYIKQYENSCA